MEDDKEMNNEQNVQIYWKKYCIPNTTASVRVAALDREEAAGVVDLEFREVFDTVSHDLPSKLRKGSL